MFTVKTKLEQPGLQKIHLLNDGTDLIYFDVLKLWQDSQAFRLFWIKMLKDSGFSAFRWETPALMNANAKTIAFECVLIKAPSLDKPANETSFAKQFAQLPQTTQAITFANLGGDATLIVPSKQVDASGYSHIAAFTKHAPHVQQHALWQLVGKTMLESLGAEPIWLNTAGAGVAWLHIRLDSHPKYYSYSPYRGRP